MIDSRGHIILIDYGLSKTDVSNPTGAMSLVGTPDYSAPEVLRTGVFRCVCVWVPVVKGHALYETMSVK